MYCGNTLKKASVQAQKCHRYHETCWPK